ncbi:MAG: carboxymuconolactone decarboxylase family protein [Bacteroidetes bacterium]|nr:carboxymuconolactone decarboxylase family protein [Bacteroidota bacterium]
MANRLNMAKTQPTAYHALLGLEKYLETTQISKSQKDLIKIRASQINGCAFCINMHTKEARSHGETEQRIYLLNAWREVDNLFSEEEKAILALTEEVTHISAHGVSDTVYQKAQALLGDVALAQVLMVIIAINAWNRMSISLQTQPE